MVNLLNFAFFQIGWFLTAYCAIYDLNLISSIFIITLSAFYIKRSSKPKVKIKLFVFAAILGFLVDSILIQLNSFSMAQVDSRVSPLFMILLWVNFIATFDYSLKWIHNYKKIAVVFALIGAPLTYYMGAKIGVIVLNQSLFYSMFWIAIAWGISILILMKAYNKWH